MIDITKIKIIMKKYDFKKAKELIEKHEDNLKRATLGMHEDWFWTGCTVWDNGEFIFELNEGLTICGIDSSDWATPSIQLEVKNGDTKMIECSIGQSDKEKPSFIPLGVLSQPVQDNITPLTKE